ncbi:MAG TPA: DUF3179 domain-containing (seleno)protein, partial [Cyclobacteriaceae bacterium]|nr:DUF3179 domain-containing (seleno)protein [Cyclobacteriaceae bacterium]
MKKLFYCGALGVIVFEILNVYFIMPMPGSQRMNSINFAYFLYSYRWIFRIVFIVMIAAGSGAVFNDRKKLLPAVVLAIALGIAYVFNFRMTADHMFLQPEKLIFKSKGENKLNDSSIVVSIENNGVVKAYPIRFIGYHHQVQDTVGGKPVIVTYCTVCRTGRAFEPMVKGRHEKFRLVGMDHFNAMFEDGTTRSWWRQATGEAIVGPLKGEVLPEVESSQQTVGKLFELHPDALVMQLDEFSKDHYDSLARYERGKSKSGLTLKDSLSWKDKSWVIGVQLGSETKAYDWEYLKSQRIINDQINNTPIVVALSGDKQSFVVFQRPSDIIDFTIRHDSLVAGGVTYDFSGRNTTMASDQLKR